MVDIDDLAASVSAFWLMVVSCCAQWSTTAVVSMVATALSSATTANESVLSGFYAMGMGFMLATSVIGLLSLAVENVRYHWPSVPAALVVVPLCVVGALCMRLVSYLLHKHEDTRVRESLSLTTTYTDATSDDRPLPPPTPRSMLPPYEQQHRTAMVVALGVALQQIPEGIITGMVFGNIDAAPDMALRVRAFEVAFSLTLSSILGCIPEALSIVLPLHGAGVERWKLLLSIHMIMLVQTTVTLISFLLVSLAQAILPVTLALGGGALFYITIGEMAPHAFSEPITKHKRNAALTVGAFLLMFALLV